LDFRGPITGSLKSPCATSIDTIALNCLVFEKNRVFAFWRQTDKQTDKQTDEQMDSIDALSRSHCRERRLNNACCIFAARCYASAAYAIMRCPCVCLSARVFVTFVHSVKTNKDIFEIFSPSGSHTIPVFPYQMGWRHSDGNLPNGGVKCRWGRQKSRF